MNNEPTPPIFLHTGKFIINVSQVRAVEHTAAQPERTKPDGKYGGTITTPAVPVVVAIMLGSDEDLVILEGEPAERVWAYFEKQADNRCLPVHITVEEELARR